MQSEENMGKIITNSTGELLPDFDKEGR